MACMTSSYPVCPESQPKQSPDTQSDMEEVCDAALRSRI